MNAEITSEPPGHGATASASPESWLELAQRIRDRHDEMLDKQLMFNYERYSTWSVKHQHHMKGANPITKAEARAIDDQTLRELKRLQADEIAELGYGHGPDEPHPLDNSESELS